MVSTLRSTSIASAFLKSTPTVAPLPVATMIEIGVASPSAHGQAIMRTATAFTRAWASFGSGPNTVHTPNVTTEIVITAGTKYPATMSASFWMGARLRWASETIFTIWASSVSEPTRSARITNPPVPFTVAPMTRSPGFFSTGIGSPLTIASSTALLPSSTTPSTGTFSPGRTRRRSPGFTASSDTSSSAPSSRTRRAVFGAKPRSNRMAAPVRPRARSSSTCPSRTRVTIAAAASKYTPTVPSGPRNAAGNSPGASAATRL